MIRRCALLFGLDEMRWRDVRPWGSPGSRSLRPNGADGKREMVDGPVAILARRAKMRRTVDIVARVSRSGVRNCRRECRRTSRGSELFQPAHQARMLKQPAGARTASDLTRLSRSRWIHSGARKSMKSNQIAPTPRWTTSTSIKPGHRQWIFSLQDYRAHACTPASINRPVQRPHRGQCLQASADHAPLRPRPKPPAPA